jgi:hypothetical protein
MRERSRGAAGNDKKHHLKWNGGQATTGTNHNMSTTTTCQSFNRRNPGTEMEFIKRSALGRLTEQQGRLIRRQG